MFNLHITLAMALAGLTDIVERFGKHHVATPANGACAYIVKVEGQRLVPECIIGQFFADLGILRVLLSDNAYGVAIQNCNMQNAPGTGSDEFRELCADFGITFSDEAYSFIRAAQASQDNEYAWGKAVEDAAVEILQARNEPRTAVEILALQAEDGDTGKPTVR